MTINVWALIWHGREHWQTATTSIVYCINSLFRLTCFDIQYLLEPAPSDTASGKKKCGDCNINDIFNYDFKKCRECIKKSICTKCFSSAQEYQLQYSFKYILEYCQVVCNR